MERKVVSKPDGSNPETAGLAVQKNDPHPAKGDIEILNIWSQGPAENIHVDEEEVDDLIEALKEVSSDEEE